MIDINNMNEMQKRIYDNIHNEAMSHVKFATPLKDRGLLWTKIQDDALEAARLLYKPVVKRGRNNLTPEQRLRRKQEKMARKNGFSYDEWLKICKSHYSIDPLTFTVTSIAHGPDHAKTWSYSTELAAEEQVYKLMTWRYYDHYERDGCETTEFKYVPDSAREDENGRAS